MRPARAREESGLTLTPVPPKELVQPTAVHAVRPRELADRPTLAQVCFDQISPDVHPETSSPHGSDVLTHLSPRCRLSPDLAHLSAHRISRVCMSERPLDREWPLSVFVCASALKAKEVRDGVTSGWPKPG